ncbi:hypothetical protein VP01_4608g2, partial [Puccinia sorghi]
ARRARRNNTIHPLCYSSQARGHAAITTTQSWFQSNATFYMVFNLRSIPTVQLSKVAEDHSKGCFSADDEEFFLKFYQEQQKNLVIKAIERVVSLSMVHNFLGRRIAVREANKWNQFLQTNQAQAIFQMSGQGIKDKNIMNKLSEAYAKLTPEEKAALAKSATPTDTLVEELINCPDQMGTTFNQQPPPQTQPGHQRTQADCTLTAKELALDDLSEDDAQLPSNSAPTMLHYLLAVNIAQTCNCEVVLFAVTKHLSKHSLNFSRWTPGAKESHQKISDLDGNMHYSARLQALINGNTVKNHAVAQKFPGMKTRPHQGPANTRRFEVLKQGCPCNQWTLQLNPTPQY